jgi:hypothetical protein
VGTFERPFARVDPHMVYKIARLGKPFVTNFANVRFVSCVSPHVNEEVALGIETFHAKCTRKRITRVAIGLFMLQ